MNELMELSYAERRKGAWLQTWTGRKVYPLDPSPEQICLADIARSLSLLCRYVGHLDCHYSVAQHSVIAARYAESLGLDPRPVLLHDAAEAYLGDFPGPIKSFIPGLNVIEQRLLRVIGMWAGVELDPLPDYVHVIDQAVMCAERWTLKCQDNGTNDWMLPPASKSLAKQISVQPYRDAQHAEMAFLFMFRRLFPGVH